MLDNIKTAIMREDVINFLHDLDENNNISIIDSSLSDLRMSKIPGVYHKDVLTHSIQVLENAIKREKNGPDLILRTASLFHDIGKPATRKSDPSRKTVTFDRHENIGAHMVKKILPKHGYSKIETNLISELVRNHMRSYGYNESNWTNRSIRSLISSSSSEKQLERLFTLFYSDVTTKNINKRNRIHCGLDNLRERVNIVRELDSRDKLRPALNGKQIMEIFNIPSGPELGKVMKFLNSDEGIHLSEEDVIKIVSTKFFGKVV